MLNKIKYINKKTLIFSLCLSLSVISPTKTQASSAYVIFPSTAYANAALMDLVENLSFTLDGTFVNFNYKYKGSQAGAAGTSAKVHKTYTTVSGKLYWRVAPKVVIGIDVYDPLLLLINFKKGKGGNQDGLRDVLKAKSYSPKISYQFTDRLTLGAGVDFVHRYEIKLDLPGFPGGTLETDTKSFTTTFNLGFLFKLKPTSLISGSFHKGIKSDVKGSSELGGVKTTNAKINGPVIPDIYTLNYTQIFSKEWLASIYGRFLRWNVVKNLKISNTPIGEVVLPMSYKNAWVFGALARYQFHPMWAVILGGEHYTSPQRTAFRTVALPANTSWLALGALQFMPNENFVIGLASINGFSNPKFDNGLSTGKGTIVASIINLSLTYKF